MLQRNWSWHPLNIRGHIDIEGQEVEACLWTLLEETRSPLALSYLVWLPPEVPLSRLPSRSLWGIAELITTSWDLHISNILCFYMYWTPRFPEPHHPTDEEFLRCFDNEEDIQTLADVSRL
jgi:hypothetical protein